MKTYIGVKIVQAEPLSLGEYNKRRGWNLPADENPLRAGFYLRYPDGYVSWSPAEIFNGSYRLISDDERGLVTAAPAPGTFYDRLLVESKELEERYSKLVCFMGLPGFYALPEIERQALEEQAAAMDHYRQILGQRIGRLGTNGSAGVIEENFETVGDVKIIGGDKAEEPIPFS